LRPCFQFICFKHAKILQSCCVSCTCEPRRVQLLLTLHARAAYMRERHSTKKNTTDAYYVYIYIYIIARAQKIKGHPAPARPPPAYSHPNPRSPRPHASPPPRLPTPRRRASAHARGRGPPRAALLKRAVRARRAAPRAAGRPRRRRGPRRVNLRPKNSARRA